MDKKRLVVEMPLELHKELKRIALNYNISLTRYVKRILIQEIYKEQRYNNE